MRIIAWLAFALLAACSTTPTQRAPVIERLPQSTKKPAPAPQPTPAQKAPPVIPGTAAAEKDWRPDTYTVKKGDTLYSIGLEFGYDYKELAQRNNINPPYVIYVGQALKLKTATTAATAESASVGPAIVTPMKTEPPVTAKSLGESALMKTEPSATAKLPGEPPLKTEPKAIKEPYSLQAMQVPPPKPETAAKPAETTPKTPETGKTETAKAEPAKNEMPTDKSAQPAADDAVDWGWPAQGKILNGFNESDGAKGMDIAGTQGQPVFAAAAGKVVYSGAGLRGYGKLVIIKHNKTYLSAYAHNSQILVKEGQEVTKGQKIAEMGSTDADQVKLHFEIRKLGKPVDPSRYLAEKP